MHTSDLSRDTSRKEKKNSKPPALHGQPEIICRPGRKIKRPVRTIHRFSNDICMEFGLDKCAKRTMKKGKKITSDCIEGEEGKFVEDLAEESAYKHLGREENNGIEHKKVREKIKKESLSCLKMICKSKLTPKNKIAAVNQMAIPVMTYGFGIVD